MAGIKGTYTVKQGDRITYIASWFNVTVQEIVNVNPQIFTTDRLARSNELIAAETIFPGELLIYPGEVLNIPEGVIDQITTEQTIKVDNNDDLTIKIDGKITPLPHRFEFIEYFDTCSDSFSFVFPYDSSLKNPAFDIDFNKFKTEGLPAVKIYIGEDPVLTGEIEVPAYAVTPSQTSITLAGRSATYLLEKSDFLPSILREFLDQSLKEISEKVAGSYSIGVEIDSRIELGENFEKATAEDNEKPYTFIARLARERSLIISKTNTGKAFITKAFAEESVAFFKVDSDFLKFIGVQTLEFTFDTREIAGQYIGKTQTPDDQNLVSTVQSQILKQISVKITSYEDADEKSLDSITAWEEQKTVRQFYKNQIPYPSWLNPNTGERWKAGQIITLQVEDAAIKDPIRMLIRTVAFVKDTGDKRTATLSILPEEVYI